MTSLDPATHRRLIASAKLAESNHEGERAAALRAVTRLLPHGISLADVLDRGLSAPQISQSPEPIDLRTTRAFRDSGDWMSPWRRKAKKLLQRHGQQLNCRERNFLTDMAVRRDEPTHKQSDWLDSLTARFPVGGQL